MEGVLLLGPQHYNFDLLLLRRDLNLLVGDQFTSVESRRVMELDAVREGVHLALAIPNHQVRKHLLRDH